MQPWMWWTLGAVALWLMAKPGVSVEAQVSAEDVQNILSKNKDAQLIDVRSGAEYSGGHLNGAKNIPLDQLQGRLTELHQDKTLIVYCRSGQRSAMALKLLRRSRFPQAKHLRGGLLAWQKAGQPVTR